MNDVNNLDPNDVSLKAVMGAKFQDVSGSQKPVAKKSVQETRHEKKPCRKAEDDSWEPVKEDPTQLSRLKVCGKNTLLFGGLCLLVFYWQQTGQMLPSAAVPCMMACCGGAMWHINQAFYYRPPRNPMPSIFSYPIPQNIVTNILQTVTMFGIIFLNKCAHRRYVIWVQSYTSSFKIFMIQLS